MHSRHEPMKPARVAGFSFLSRGALVGHRGAQTGRKQKEAETAKPLI